MGQKHGYIFIEEEIQMASKRKYALSPNDQGGENERKFIAATFLAKIKFENIQMITY